MFKVEPFETLREEIVRRIIDTIHPRKIICLAVARGALPASTAMSIYSLLPTRRNRVTAAPCRYTVH
ncbi:MAG TPA: hypothetical protein VJ020_11315 [Anaerolineales bacterium]|nr:hypothetical protein [Anaerolineales bacterium]